MIAQDLHEAFGVFVAGGLERAVGNRVERDHIDMTEQWRQLAAQFVGEFGAVVDAAHKRVLEGDAAVGLFDVALHSGQEIVHSPAAVDGDELPA